MDDFEAEVEATIARWHGITAPNDPARRMAAVTCSAVQAGWRDHHRAASAAAWGAAAEVPEKGRGRHRLGMGIGATRSGLGAFEFGPHEL